MTDAPATALLIERRIAELQQSRFGWRKSRDMILLMRASAVIDQLLNDLGDRRHETQIERARAEAAEIALATAREAAGFERNGFDKLAGLRDDCATVKDLLKALDLIGDGIGGDVGFALSAVADQAAISAANAYDAADSMLAMRGEAAPS